MLKPLVSILIPFKNTSNFLPACIESILDQEYKNWEILAVDDHSSDESWSLLETFANDHKQIKVFKNSGSGIIDALRTAYDQSQGVLITRMDSDDVMKPNRLGVMSRSLINKGTKHIALGQVKYFSARGIGDGYARYEQWINSLVENGTNYSEIYKECVIPSPCWMVYREDLNACGAFEPNRYPEDYDLAFRFYKHRYTCIPSKHLLHLWGDYDTRTSRTSEHYAQNYFIPIKLHYFLELDYDPKRTLVLWGAGKRGKALAKSLLYRKVKFYWLCDNPNKIGKIIYGQEMLHYEALGALGDTQSIISVTNEKAQLDIRNYFSDLGFSSMLDYFFFC